MDSNVYYNICFSDDDNRIVLKPLSDVSDYQRDYINACYVDVREFITCSKYQSLQYYGMIDF
jgi:protein tyrosine phosphatase